jgi:2-polyprenyl-3-methyl-5-hydroxy-6-metoxy-1,4-benzoquinol methylase
MISVKCNLCGYDETSLVQKAEPPFCVVQCRHCGLVYTNPIPDNQKLEEHYDEEYYRDWIHKQMDSRRRMWTKRLKELKHYKTRGRLLDVGCGLRTFLELASETGFQVQGTDVSGFISDQTRDHNKIDVFHGELISAQFPKASFDVITLWHSLEHMPDPKGNLTEVKRILKDDGILLIAVPNLKNYIMRFCYLLIKGKKYALFSRDAKELHLYHFTAQTLSRMLEEVGFEPLKVKLDLSAVVLQRKFVDWISAFVYALTGRNFADGFKIVARKNPVQ